MWTASQLSAQLATAGITRDDVLIVHASLRSIGAVDGAAAAVVRVLMGACGTLLMPAFSDPQPDGVFHAESTGSRVGYLTESFRTTPGVRRSLHPTHSVSAHGPLADAFLTGHQALGGLSKDSPFHRAARCGAKILMIGCPMTTCSAVHIAESIERVPYLGRVWYEGYDRTLTVDPGAGQAPFDVAAKDPPTCSIAFGRVEERMRSNSKIREVSFGSARCHLFRGIDAIDAARELLRANPLALLCNHPRCSVCNTAKAIACAREGPG
jgi:aminoglycoside N3'-acetyltransferase